MDMRTIESIPFEVWNGNLCRIANEEELIKNPQFAVAPQLAKRYAGKVAKIIKVYKSDVVDEMHTVEDYLKPTDEYCKLDIDNGKILFSLNMIRMFHYRTGERVKVKSLEDLEPEIETHKEMFNYNNSFLDFKKKWLSHSGEYAHIKKIFNRNDNWCFLDFPVPDDRLLCFRNFLEFLDKI